MTEGEARRRMVAEQIRARGVRDERVLAALERVPRESFIPADLRHEAHRDYPVPIGHGQTISQPYIVGYMTEALNLDPHHRVLEIGTGCGYQTAVLAELVAEVYSIELIPELADRARETVGGMGYANITIRTGDGYQGWPDRAPFDRIIGAAAAPAVPAALIDQLTEGGLLVIPVGVASQVLQVVRKRGDSVETLNTLPVRFVPMVRAH